MLLPLLMALAWIRRGLGHAVGGAFGRRQTAYVADRVDEYRGLWMAAALAIGASFSPLASDAWEVATAQHRTRISNDLVEFDDPVVLAIAGDKELCYAIAGRLGIPTPGPRTSARSDVGRAMWRMPLGDTPLVVKPARGTGSGVGVTVGVRTRSSLVSALALAATHSSRVIVESLVAAETVRLLFLDGEMIHAVRRRGERVVGDGAATLRELLARQAGGGVEPDWLVRETLRQQGRVLDEVVPGGVEVLVRWLAAGIRSSPELKTIYDENVTELVSAELIAELAPLLGEVGTRFAAVDVATIDLSRPLRESGGVFLEINTTPGIRHHCGSLQLGGPCPVAVTVLRRLLEIDEPSRVA